MFLLKLTVIHYWRFHLQAMSVIQTVDQTVIVENFSLNTDQQSLRQVTAILYSRMFAYPS